MQPNNQMHGICKECLAQFDYSSLKAQKSTACAICRKDQPDIIHNHQAICTSCYLKMISPSKIQVKSSVKAHKKSKSFYRPVSKKQIMNSSFLSSKGKLIKKIQKLFNQFVGNEAQLLKYLNKKALLSGQFSWHKLSQKVNKSSSIIYIFIGKQDILGAFHTQSIPIGQNSTIEDSECGIFYSQRSTINLQFFRVKNDRVSYSNKSQTIRFGSPSSFDIVVGNNLQVSSQLKSNFEWMYCFVYHPGFT